MTDLTGAGASTAETRGQVTPAFSVDVITQARRGRNERWRLPTVLGSLGIGAAAALYIWFVHQYGVNAIYYDQWDNIALLTHSSFFLNSYSGHTTLSTLWVQHNENRMLFPNLVVLALGATTHFNILTELYLAAVVAIGSTLLLLYVHHRDLPSTRLVWYAPFAFSMLTLGQFGDTLFGFQIAWFMILLCLATAIFALDRDEPAWGWVAAGAVAAIIGSFSSLQGLLIWPAGLLVLWWRRSSTKSSAAWSLAAIATTFLYFFHYDSSGAASDNGFALSHPLSVVRFFLLALGDVMGKPLAQSSRASDPSLVELGGVIFAIAVVCLVIYGRRRRRGAGSPVGPALICFGLLFAAVIAIGRAHLGIEAAAQSRYVTFDVLVLAGCWLCLVETWPVSDRDTAPRPLRSLMDDLATHPAKTMVVSWRAFVVIGLQGVVLMILIAETLFGSYYGVKAARGTRSANERAALVTVHAEQAPNSLIRSALFPNQYADPDQIRTLATNAQTQHLSLFATGDARRLASTPLPRPAHYVVPRVTISSPSSGAIVAGRVLLVVAASADFRVTSVTLTIIGPGGETVATVRTRPTLFGWLGAWDSVPLAKATYSLQASARDATGGTGTSRPITVLVRN